MKKMKKTKKVKTKKYENYLDELIATKEVIGRTEMEKQIARATGYRLELINRLIGDVDELLRARFERFGVITKEDNMEALREGYDILCKVSVTLEDIRKMIQDFNIEENSPIGILIKRDWNYAGNLLQDYLMLENNNLMNYKNLLEEAQSRIKDNNPMYSTYTDRQLKAVYTYLCEKGLFCSSKDYSNFRKIFRACNLDVTKCININTESYYGARAALRVVVELLTGKFTPSLVNKYFCDYQGNNLNLASHNRSTSYGELEDALEAILKENA